MERLIKCVICGTEFKSSRPRRKYCSFSCKEAGAIIRRKVWENNNPDYIRKYMQEYRKNGGTKK